MFEGRLALNPGLNLARVSFSFVQKHFLGQFSLIFIEHRIINLLTKIIKLNLLFKLSYLNSSFALTPGYLNPALNNPALVNFPGHEFLGTKPRFKRRKTNLWSCVYGLQLKSCIREFHVAGRAATARKCIKKCAARAELLFC